MARECEVKLNEPQIFKRNSLARCGLWPPPPGLLSPFTAMTIHDHSVTVQRILARPMDEPSSNFSEANAAAPGGRAVFGWIFGRINALFKLDAKQRHDMLRRHHKESSLPNT